jgi:hypothetical protein
MPAKTIVLTLPPIAAHVLAAEAERVRLTPAELCSEALRTASWFRESVARTFPPELLIVDRQK